MMYISSENSVKIPFSDENCCSQFFYEFSMEKLDYFYVLKPIWDSFATQNYYFLIAGAKICVPSGLYVMICDEYGDLDWIPVDEIIGRDISLLVINDKFNGWDHVKPELLEAKSDTVYIPSTKSVLPLTDSKNSKMILVCRTDQYKNTTGLFADDFLAG